MPVVAAPADRRFRRAHVKPAKRARVRLKVVARALAVTFVLAVTVYGAWRARTLLLGMQSLQVSRIEVHGNARLSAGEVRSLVSDLDGQHLLRLGLDEWRDKLLAQPWIADATLRRVLPGTVDIAIREREPLAIARMRGRLYLVDASGAVIDEYGPNYADIDLPIVDGLAAPGAAEGTPDGARVALAGRLLAALDTRPDLAARVSQIEVTDARSVMVMIEEDPAMLRLGDRDFVERLQSYVDLAPALRERVDDIDYVDLRFNERLYVRPAALSRGEKD